MTSPEKNGLEPDRVELRVPADVAYVSTLRLAAASLATRCGLTIDDIEDLRLAVDEACALLLPHATDDTTLDARFVLGDGNLAVESSVQSVDTAQPDREGFAWTVLGALASSVDVAQSGDRLTITVTKKREAAAR
ncbi:ATP-binding protein [uncultured Jatrophihabitans sp.]|uniref:ATP-binding protein n=1 Tax=uncultured Jatrophihabitans sp. TaxID=1610747 RepID=UPI0035CAE66D